MSVVRERDVKARVHRRLAADGLGDRPLPARLAELVEAEAPLLPVSQARALVGELVHEVSGLGPLEPVLADPEVDEIMVNGPGRAWVERAGRLEPVELALERGDIERIVERAVAPLGLRCDRTAPVVDARLPDGSRFHAVLPPLAVDGPYVTIRRFRARRVPLAAFGAEAPLAGLLGWAVEAGWNVLVAGGTSSGKTTLLNTLSALVPAGERVVTIEETAELRLDQPHVVRLEARPPNAEGAGGFTIGQLVRAALRMRPDRIVVGEVRGGEALDMVEALNTGHDGSMSTIHANGPAEALLRLEYLAGALAPQVGVALDAVVHVARAGDGARRIRAVAEVGRGAGPSVRLLWPPGETRLTRPARRYDAPPPPGPWEAP